MICIIIDSILRSGFRAVQSLRGRGQEEMPKDEGMVGQDGCWRLRQQFCQTFPAPHCASGALGQSGSEICLKAKLQEKLQLQAKMVGWSLTQVPLSNRAGIKTAGSVG